MGMYDYIRCEWPLPNLPDCFNGAEFQTKDFACVMEHYTITADGRLLEAGGGPFAETKSPELYDYTGQVNFYTNNIVASGPGTYTKHGEDAQSVEYQARFENGQLLQIIEIKNSRQRAAKHKPGNLYPKRTEEELRRDRERFAERLMGKRLILWWGGDVTPPYEATVVAENDQWLVLEDAKGKYQIMHRSDRDRLLVDSLGDGQRYRDERKARWEAERRDYEREIGEPSGTVAEVQAGA